MLNPQDHQGPVPELDPCTAEFPTVGRKPLKLQQRVHQGFIAVHERRQRTDEVRTLEPGGCHQRAITTYSTTREVHELAVSVQYFWSFWHSRKDRYFVDRNHQFVDLPRMRRVHQGWITNPRAPGETTAPGRSGGQLELGSWVTNLGNFTWKNKQTGRFLLLLHLTMHNASCAGEQSHARRTLNASCHSCFVA